MNNARLLKAAAAIHDDLEGCGYSHEEIVGILAAGMGYSLTQLPPRRRALALDGHFAGLAEIGIEIVAPGLYRRPGRRH